MGSQPACAVRRSAHLAGAHRAHQDALAAAATSVCQLLKPAEGTAAAVQNGEWRIVLHHGSPSPPPQQ
jgi:hypothetical protein